MARTALPALSPAGAAALRSVAAGTAHTRPPRPRGAGARARAST
ncbi:hypothetical protein ACQPZA_10860 [Pseudonocardia xinjiangensis]